MTLSSRSICTYVSCSLTHHKCSKLRGMLTRKEKCLKEVFSNFWTAERCISSPIDRTQALFCVFQVKNVTQNTMAARISVLLKGLRQEFAYIVTVIQITSAGTSDPSPGTIRLGGTQTFVHKSINITSKVMLSEANFFL